MQTRTKQKQDWCPALNFQKEPGDAPSARSSARFPPSSGGRSASSETWPRGSLFHKLMISIVQKFEKILFCSKTYCTARKTLQNPSLLAIRSVHTAENEQSKVALSTAIAKRWAEAREDPMLWTRSGLGRAAPGHAGPASA